MRHLSPSPCFRLRSIVTRIIFFWPCEKNWISFREILYTIPRQNVFIDVLFATSSPKFKAPNPSIYDLWFMLGTLIQTLKQESFPPFPSGPKKNAHLSTTLAACCPPPKRFTSENTVGHLTNRHLLGGHLLSLRFFLSTFLKLFTIKWKQTKKQHVNSCLTFDWASSNEFASFFSRPLEPPNGNALCLPSTVANLAEQLASDGLAGDPE